eukprot:TRINITY_DN7545_c0_g1_i1.p1 TRINITY_DN7545_c0_g1~~TRINITY_DN7545_c0_g1_i1.p1  ORF type:complete len:444 (+),score=112.20 TRINITY_DN7545_c0_g1_i1:87-1418(+)
MATLDQLKDIELYLQAFLIKFSKDETLDSTVFVDLLSHLIKTIISFDSIDSPPARRLVELVRWLSPRKQAVEWDEQEIKQQTIVLEVAMKIDTSLSSGSFLHEQLVQLLTSSDTDALIDAYSKYTSKNSTRNVHLRKLFQNFIKLFDVSTLVDLFATVVMEKKAAWRTLLLFVEEGSTSREFSSEFLVFLKKLSTIAFNSLSLEKLHIVLLFSRMFLAQEEGEKNTSEKQSYSTWFQDSFLDGSTLNSKKLELFFLQVLTDLVPCEPIFTLKQHIRLLPRLTRIKQQVSDYISLAKTKLNDLGDVESGSSSSSSTLSASNPEKLLQDLIQKFNTTKRLPDALTQAYIFNKAWYREKFLPILLSHDILECKGKKELIEALSQRCMIPQKDLLVYQSFTKSPRDPHTSLPKNAHTSPLTLLSTLLEALLDAVANKWSLMRSIELR